MTADADRLAEVELDAAQRHRALREQYRAWQRDPKYDGHNKKPANGKAALRRRKQRRRAAARLRDRVDKP